MKNKKSTIGLMLLLAGSLVLTNCTKNKTNTAPTPDAETTATPKLATTTEAVNVQMILSDIHEIAAQVCETNPFLLGTHDGTPLSTTMGTVTINSANAVIFADLMNEFFTVTFNNTIGKDGHVRNGVLKFNYAPTVTSTIDHYRLPTFIFDVTSTGYTMDSYSVQINNMRIENITPAGFPSTIPNTPALGVTLKWKQTADVSIMSMSGSSTLTTTFAGEITKEILNTNNTPIPMPAGYPTTYTIATYPVFSSLKNEKCLNSYVINGNGILADGSSYTIMTTSPLTRNMVSSPEVFVSFNGAIISTERHPFLTGVLSFKPASKSVRTIDFGASGEIVDYNAKVTVDGTTYDLDIK